MILGTLIGSNRSGLEFQAKVGESYVFSFESLAKMEGRYHYMRMDILDDEDSVKLVLSNYQ